MPAYFDTGFSVREPMWHGGGLILDDYPTDWADARVKAGLMWEPEVRPAYFTRALRGDESMDNPDSFPSNAIPIVMNGDTRVLVPMSDHKLIVRNDNEDQLGVVGSGFELVLHSEMGGIIEAVLGLKNVKFETAGSVQNGARVWALVYLDEPYALPGDNTQTYPFLAIINVHDGSGACRLVVTQVRIVCWNTMQMAEAQGERTGRQFTFRHTAKVHERIEEAKAALAGVRDEAAQWTELTTELFGMPVSDAQFNHFVADFIPEPPAEVVSERVRENIDRARKVFKHLYLDSITTEAHRGTALGLVDASTEYLDHVRGYRNADTYMGRTLLRPEPLKAKAIALAREHSGK